MLVFGTRPEAIKLAPLIKELEKYPDKFQTIIAVTAQHRHMLDQVLKLFSITPDYDLNIMKQGQDLYDITTNVLLGLRDVFIKAKPDIVLVHGDTTTSTASAMAAFYAQIPVGHIEAGLRTNNIYNPWPEEINRQITSRIATYHFAPTILSRQNLIKENINENSIHVTGNTVIDALHWVLTKLANNTDLSYSIINILTTFGIPKDKINSWENKLNGLRKHRKLVLITGHRREIFGQGFINICEAIKELSIIFPDVDFVYPMHLNPNVRKPISQIFCKNKYDTSKINNINHNTLFYKKLLKTYPNIYFIEPLDYLPFVYLMNLSYLILTDSGGVQEEAPGLGKPVLVMRNYTERPEAVDAGIVKLVGTDKEQIINEVKKLIENHDHYLTMSRAENPYGDGMACSKIVQSL